MNEAIPFFYWYSAHAYVFEMKLCFVNKSREL